MPREIEKQGIYAGVVIRGHMCFDNSDIGMHWPEVLAMFRIPGELWNIKKMNAYIGYEVFGQAENALLSRTVWEKLLDLMEERGDL